MFFPLFLSVVGVNPYLQLIKCPPWIVGQIFDQAFDQIFCQGKTINTAYSTTRPKEINP